jgi:hypothetical protein
MCSNDTPLATTPKAGRTDPIGGTEVGILLPRRVWNSQRTNAVNWRKFLCHTGRGDKVVIRSDFAFVTIGARISLTGQCKNGTLS